ncbi:hypothetical protein DEA8626_02167 [Defluviimonas aquaemixtae]|uniref:Rieske domain-containing protein n=1 Tax=Albidovulum aquaemixtae TaxID=1542388 RepID=A0A2R8B7Q6_9RHOB|nr:Rieske 2Fe-2S domain-containing protein [Defluviimonas aquaemixtae]SPH18627.1 hypothetical protein DEA8626_02167 [Defluviimonas aquaemixtae]
MKVELCKSEDVPAEGTVVLPFFGKEVHVWRDSKGRARAAANTCLHFGGPLEARGCQLVCPWHGAAYDLETGVKIDGPGRSDAKLLFLSTCEEDGALNYVWGE